MTRGLVQAAPAAGAKIGDHPNPPGTTMSNPAPRQSHADEAVPHDPVENIIHAVPIVLPLVGGVLMFLLAFIAIYMA